VALNNCSPCLSTKPASISRGALREEFLLGVQEPVPAAISPEPVLRGIRAKGYYMWRSGYTNQPRVLLSEFLVSMSAVDVLAVFEKAIKAA
jgi:hypothetical protein